MCNATAAFIHVASTRADPISCLVAACSAIYGPLHGGSNIITHKQHERIGTPARVAEVVQQVLQGKQRLFGFGHRDLQDNRPSCQSAENKDNEIS